jgi:hypothetical protein
MKERPPKLLGKARTAADALLEGFGMEPTHPYYEFYHDGLVRYFEKMLGYTEAFRAVGRALDRLTDNDPVDVAEIRKLAAELRTVELGFNYGAIRMICMGLPEVVKRHKTNGYLKPFPPSVTDEQIRAILGDPAYPTRQTQADKLGISLRSLQRRLKKLSPSKE